MLAGLGHCPKFIGLAQPILVMQFFFFFFDSYFGMNLNLLLLAHTISFCTHKCKASSVALS